MREICNVVRSTVYYALAHSPTNPIASTIAWACRAQVVIGLLGAAILAYRARQQTSSLRETGMQKALNTLYWTPAPIWGLFKMVRNFKGPQPNPAGKLSDKESALVRSYGSDAFKTQLSELPPVAKNSPVLLELVKDMVSCGYPLPEFINAVETILSKAKDGASIELARFKGSLACESGQKTSLIARLLSYCQRTNNQSVVPCLEQVLEVYGKFRVADSDLPGFLASELEAAFEYGYEVPPFSIVNWPKESQGQISLNDPQGREYLLPERSLHDLLNEYAFPIPVKSFGPESGISEEWLNVASARIITYGGKQFIVKGDVNEPFKTLEESYYRGQFSS